MTVLLDARVRNTALTRVLLVIAFAALTAITARIRIELPFTPVPFTLQVLAVLLAGLVLGAREGAASQLLYVAAITAGLPIDTGALGPAVWTQASAGYLLGFVAGAFVAGELAPRGSQSRARSLVAGAAGVAAIYLVGMTWLTLVFFGGDWAKGLALGVAPFIAGDLVKALVASAVAEGSRALLARF